VGDIEGVGLAYAAEVVAVGGGCFVVAVARMEALAHVCADKGCQRCIGAPRVLPFLCLCAAIRLWHAEL
jgi:hypothetical protein